MYPYVQSALTGAAPDGTITETSQKAVVAVLVVILYINPSLSRLLSLFTSRSRNQSHSFLVLTNTYTLTNV